jgi:nucleoside diphosphate kinase
MQMAGSDDDDDDSEEEDLMAIRSKLKEQSKKVSPEEQEAEDRRKQAQMFLELRAQQDREEQEGRRQQELQRKLAEEARQKQLDELAAESARRRREMDREREEREKLEREELKQRQAKADEEAAALAGAPAPASRAAVDEKSNVAANSATFRTPAGTSAAAAECEIETAGGNENNETQRLLEERVQSGALRHKKMLELSKGPMPALPSALFFELSQREALTHLPEAVEHHCVLVLPDMAPALLAGVLHWIITPSSLQTSLEAAAPSECEAYGLTGDDQEAEQAPASAPRAGKNNSNSSLPVFPFQVVGVMRGCLSAGHCMPSLLPASTQTRGSCGGAAEPVVMIALAPPQNARMPVAGAAGVPDLARSVKELLATVRLEDVYLGDKSCMPVHDTYLNLAISASLEAATSVISGKCAVSSTIKSPLLWFVCAPAAAADDSDGGDAANAASSASSARISSDDTVVSVLRPEAVRNGALGPILVRLAQENMDVVALRMLFPSTEHYVRSRSFTTSVVPGGCPVIVLGTRGYKAIERWSELVGPEDPMLAKRTDPASLRAKYGMDRKRNLLTCSRSSQRNRRESEWYFSLAQDVELDQGTSTAALPQLPMMVPYRVATSTMALRAGLPGSFVAQVVSFCLRNGFGLAAFRRSVIEPSANQHVGLPAWVNIKHVRPPPVCLQWTGENAVSRLLRLAPALEKLAEDAGVPASFEEACTLTSPPRQLSHRANPTKAFESVGNVMAVARNLEAAQRCGLHLGLDAGPECIDVVRFSSRLADMPARFVATQGAPEAVCVVVTQDAVSDASAMSDIFEVLLINTGAELLGAKLLHWLPDHVAAEACPYAKDHYLRADCLEHLESGQAFVIAMRMVDGLERMRKIVGPLPGTGALALSRMSRSAPGCQHDTETLRSKFAVDGVRCAVLMPNDAKHAVRLMSCVFEDDELSWPTNPLGPMALVPPPASENVIEALKAEAGGPPPLRTVALVKAEARQNFGKILKYVRRGEFKIVALKVISPTQVCTNEKSECARLLSAKVHHSVYISCQMVP